MDSDHNVQGKRVVWVTRSFLDYRVPVYAELDALLGGTLTVIYNGDYVPERVQSKLRKVLGDRSVALHGERRVGPNAFGSRMANRAIRIPWQPGLRHAIRRCEPELLISDGFFQWTAACLWWRARHGVPHVMCYERTAHTERMAQWYRTRYRKWVLSYVDAVCCSGKLCEAYIRSLGVRKELINRGHMVADIEGMGRERALVDMNERARIREQYGLHGVVYLCAGQLIQRKGIMELLHAWRQFAGSLQERSTATLAIVGDGPERASLARYGSANGLVSVRFLGGVDYDRMVPLYAAADCLVMPTLEDNWSLVVPEAMACGLPVLCSRYNGCWPELVAQDSNGWLFDPCEQAGFVSTLRMAFDGAERLKSMGLRSQAIVAAHTPRSAARAIAAAGAVALTSREMSPCA